MTKKTYELMRTFSRESSDQELPEDPEELEELVKRSGVDSETATVGHAIQIIKYLLRHDESVSNYKLVKKKGRKARK